MSAVSLTALLLPVLVAYGAMRRPWHGAPAPLSRVAAASIAPGLGLGFASCLYFFLLLMHLREPLILRIDATLWVVALVVLGADAWSRRGRSTGVDHRNFYRLKVDWIALIAVAVGTLVLFALASRSFWLHRSLHPHGEWDAWAMWNLRARAILRAGPGWMSAFSNYWPNVDYPLLLPLTVGRLWAFEHAETTIIPAVVAFTFFVSTVATLTVLVGQTQGWVSGFLSGAVLLAPHTRIRMCTKARVNAPTCPSPSSS
jgi:hypothetical protein